MKERTNINKQPLLEVNSSPFQTEPADLGERIRELRLSMNLTLEQVSKLSGVARSTLSKIENQQVSPSFKVIGKLAKGLNVDLLQLFSYPIRKRSANKGRRDITRNDKGRHHPTATYEHQLLANNISNKRMIPFHSTIRAHCWDQYSDWVRHVGEEFFMVLEGSVRLYTEFYKPVELHSGDSVYFDSTMGHALISTSEIDASAIWVTA